MSDYSILERIKLYDNKAFPGAVGIEFTSGDFTGIIFTIDSVNFINDATGDDVPNLSIEYTVHKGDEPPDFHDEVGKLAVALIEKNAKQIIESKNDNAGKTDSRISIER